MNISTLALAFLVGVSNSPAAAAAADISIDVGNKRPEGIHIVSGEDIGLDSGVPHALVSEVYYGGVKAFNLESGKFAKQVVPSYDFQQRGSFGLTYHGGMIFTAGGGNAGPGQKPGQELFGNPAGGMYVYDAMTGDDVVACFPDFQGFDESAMLINDVDITGEKAYWTLSYSNKIVVMDLSALTGASPTCSLSYIDLPEDIFGVNRGLGVNGIITYDTGLLISDNSNGAVYFVDLSNSNEVTEALAPGSLLFPDGMVAVGDTVYVSEVGGGRISEFTASGMSSSSDEKGVTLSFSRAIASDLYANQSTIDVSGDTIYTVNTRFFSTDGPTYFFEGEDNISTFGVSFNIVGTSLLQDSSTSSSSGD